MRSKLVCLCFAFLVTSAQWCFADPLSAKLEKTLSDFLLHVEQTQSDTFKKMTSFDGRMTAEMKNAVSELAELKTSVCLLTRLLNAYPHQRQTIPIETYIKDLVEAQLRAVNETVEALRRRLDVNEGVSDIKLREFACTIAGNEQSITEIREKVIPTIFERFAASEKEIKSVDTKIEFLSLTYRAEFESLCSRMAAIEKELSQLRETSAQVEKAPKLSKEVEPTKVTPERSVLSAQVTVPAYQEFHPYYITPDPYAVQCQTLVRSNYVFYCTERLKTGSVINARYEGQLYQTASGRLALVVKSFDQ